MRGLVSKIYSKFVDIHHMWSSDLGYADKKIVCHRTFLKKLSLSHFVIMVQLTTLVHFYICTGNVLVTQDLRGLNPSNRLYIEILC